MTFACAYCGAGADEMDPDFQVDIDGLSFCNENCADGWFAEAEINDPIQAPSLDG